MTGEEKLYTSHQAAELLQMDPSSVVKWVNDGKLPAYRTPGGHRRIKQSDLVGFLRKHGMYVPPELSAGARRKVLLVDDDRAWLGAVKRALKNHAGQLDLQTTDSPISALVQVGAFRPDVLVLDINMPDMDGLEVLRRLRESSETRSLEVLVVSGKASPDLERKVLALGAKACLTKPVPPSELLTQLTNHHHP